MRVLLTVLGVDPKEAEYTLGEGRYPARLAPVALFELLPLGNRPEVVVALCSEQSRSEALPELKKALSGKVTVRDVSIPLVGQAGDIDGFLASVVGSCEDYPEAIFTVDVTHGFRHLSFLMYVGSLYLAALGRVTIGRIYYALLNKPPQVSPFLDLTPLLELPQWIHAIRTLRETGSAKLVGKLVQRHPDGKAIGEMMDLISGAHAAGLPIELGREVDRFFSHKTKSLRKMLRGEKLPLSGRVADQLEAAIGPYRLRGAGASKWKKGGLTLQEEELKRQAVLVGELLAKGNLPAALGLMSEWTVSWVLWNRKVITGWLDFKASRRIAAGQIGALAEAGQDLALASLLTRDQRRLAEYWRDLSTLRNALHHHGMRSQVVFGADFDAALERVTSYWTNDLCRLPRIPIEFGSSRQCLLVSPIGERPGVLFTALRRASTDHKKPDFCLLVCSLRSQVYVSDALFRAGYDGEHLCLCLEDPYGGNDERARIRREARPHLATASEVLVNITGGTTFMGVVAEDLAREARQLARPVRRFALIDKRPPEEQKREPFVEGDILWLDEEERDGDY